MSVGPITDEFFAAHLGDRRLNSRAQWFAAKLALRPERGLPSVLEDEAGLEAGYRFVNNERVDFEGLLEPHRLATARRAVAASTVVVAHDTTQFQFGDRGFGPLRGASSGEGFYLHCALVISGEAQRDPLGIISARTFQRKKRPVGIRKSMAERAEDNESRHWLAAFTEANERLGDVRAIHVMDRFADSYALLAAMTAAAAFVVRGKENRTIQLPDATRMNLGEVMRDRPVILTREVRISERKPGGWNVNGQRPPRQSRQAKLEIAAMAVRLARPGSAPTVAPKTIDLNVVQVREVLSPAESEPVEWLLCTNLPVDTAEQVAAVVDAYRARWMIEELFKAIKTGCAYESRQLESEHGLLNMLALTLPVAWRLLRIRHLARAEDAPPARAALPQSQLDVLAAVTRAKLPKNPTVTDALNAIARLGGHLKRNGPPGWMVLKRGYDELLSLERGWLLAQGRVPDEAEM